jgi:hypothetical protein
MRRPAPRAGRLRCRTLNGQRSDRRPRTCRDYRFACESRRAADLGMDERFRSEAEASVGEVRSNEGCRMFVKAELSGRPHEVPDLLTGAQECSPPY